jgi:hypothetical protein
MKEAKRRYLSLMLVVATGAAGPLWAQETETLEQEVEALKIEVQELRESLKSEPASSQEVQQLRQEVKEAERLASESKNTGSVKHFSGYADVGYSNRDGVPGSFDAVRFNPAFHYQYQDLVLLDAELEATIDQEGATDVGLEFATINLLVNDYAVVFAGKFLSPLGQFRQNLHPSWINKVATAPVGFGHDQAAPAAEVGLGVRGGVLFSDTRVNYAVYVGNGPALELNEAGDEIEMIGTEGATGDADGDKIWGARFGLVPLPGLEIGLSGATGKVAATPGGVAEAGRDYDVQGADFAYRWRNLRTRAEYISQRVGDEAASVAPTGGTWKSYYVQGSYRFGATKWEGVVRYGDYQTPHADQNQEQWALGVNYLFAPSVIAKIDYELNEGLAGTVTDADRLLLQIAYGF